MATWQSSYQYRDPEKLDISVLGKAMTYKQGMYDQNVAQVQQMVNQYAGTDLLKDIDRQYFGDRIKTIVDYVNQSGTRDWSRKSVAKGIQNYVSGAIDSNVTNAIASTMSYRKQMVEIEDIKKNKPDQYSLQNEWFATQDYRRYMTSDKVGDTYRAQTYVPYTDVKKLILDNAAKLKEFGVEYHFDAIGGNQYFTKIGSYERISEQDARQYMNMILDTKAMNQLYIDGQYTYKDLPDDVLSKKYNSVLNNMKKFNDEQISELKLQKLSANSKDKLNLENNILRYEEANKNIDLKRSNSTSRQSITNDLYMTDFNNKWVDFLSYDKLKDWKIDESGYKLEKWQNEVANAEWDKQQRVNEFQYKMMKDASDREFDKYKLNVDAATKGYKINADGSVSIDPNNPINTNNSSIYGKDVEKTLDEESRPDPLKIAESDYSKAGDQLETTVVSEIEAMLKNPNNANLRKQLEGTNSKAVAWKLINSPSYGSLIREHLSDEAISIIDRASEAKNKLNFYKENDKEISNNMVLLANSMLQSDKSNVRETIIRSTEGYVIGKDGKVVKGDLGGNNGRYSSLNKKLAAINFTLMTGDLTDHEVLRYNKMAKDAINESTLSFSQKQDAIKNMIYGRSDSGFMDKVYSVAFSINPLSKTLGKAIEGSGNILTSMTGNKAYKGAGNRIAGKINSYLGDDPNKENIIEYVNRSVNDRFKPNRRLDDLGAGNIQSFLNGDDVDNKYLRENGIDISTLSEKWKNNMERGTKLMENHMVTSFNKRFDIPFTTKDGEKMMPQFSTMLPVGTEIQKDGTAQVIIDKESGTAQVTMGVKKSGKGEKGYEAVTTTVKIQDLPTQLLNQVDLSDKNTTYSANNPFAVKYNTSVNIPENKADWYEQVQLMPESKRQEALNNPPAFKEDIINKIIQSYDPNIVGKHSDEIKQILSTPVTISTESMGNTWLTVGKIDGKAVYTLDNNHNVYDPKLMDNAKNNIATEVILTKIKEVLR